MSNSQSLSVVGFFLSLFIDVVRLQSIVLWIHLCCSWLVLNLSIIKKNLNENLIFKGEKISMQKIFEGDYVWIVIRLYKMSNNRKCVSVAVLCAHNTLSWFLLFFSFFWIVVESVLFSWWAKHSKYVCNRHYYVNNVVNLV